MSWDREDPEVSRGKKQRHFKRFKKCSQPDTPDDIGFEDRMITIERYSDLVHWDVYDPDFDSLEENIEQFADSFSIRENHGVNLTFVSFLDLIITGK